jgi:hypothetical protein
VRLDPPLFTANSGFTRSPNQVSCRRQKALGEQDLIDPAALHGDALVLKQVGCEPIQRSRREGQAPTP